MSEAQKAGQLRQEGKDEEANLIIKLLEERVRTADKVTIPNIYDKKPRKIHEIDYSKSTLEDAL
jgi:adenylate kinase family enzyme